MFRFMIIDEVEKIDFEKGHQDVYDEDGQNVSLGECVAWNYKSMSWKWYDVSNKVR